MEDRLWQTVTSILPEDKPQPRQTYSDRDVLLVVLWAALHDRPIMWACQGENWSERVRPPRLPHASTVSFWGNWALGSRTTASTSNVSSA